MPTKTSYCRLAEICAAGAAILSLLVLSSWIIGQEQIGAFGEHYKPMAPSTAGHYCSPILYGVVLGVINIYLKEGHRHDLREEEFLTSIANTLAGILIRRQMTEGLRESEKRAHKNFFCDPNARMLLSSP